MSITLRPEHEELVVKAMQTGAYENPDEIIGRALGMLYAQEDWLSEQTGEIAAKIERAFEQFDRGQFYSAEASRADMQERKAAWLQEHGRLKLANDAEATITMEPARGANGCHQQKDQDSY